MDNRLIVHFEKDDGLYIIYRIYLAFRYSPYGQP